MIKKTVTLLGVTLVFSLFLLLVCCLRIEEGSDNAIAWHLCREDALPTVRVTVDASLLRGAEKTACAAKKAACALPPALTEPFTAVLSRMGEAFSGLAAILRGERRPRDTAFVSLPSAYSPLSSHTIYGRG